MPRAFTICRARPCPAYYRDLLNTPSALNHNQTLNGYWMENTQGRYGVQLDAFGPYLLNRTQSEYFISDQTGAAQWCDISTYASSAQTNVTNIAVGDSSSFYAGTMASIAGVSGSKMVTALPDATHIMIANTTLSAASAAGTTHLRPSSIAGMAVGHAVTVDIGASAETGTITALGTGAVSTTIVAPAAAGASLLKVASITGLAAGNRVYLDTVGNIEPVTIATVGTAAGSSTTLVGPTAAGDTKIYTAGVSGFTVGHDLVIDSGANIELATISAVGTAAPSATSLAAASLVGDTNIKVASVANLTAGHQIVIDSGANIEVGTIVTVGTATATGTGVDLAAPLTLAHASGASARDRGTGTTLAAPLTLAHASGVSTRDTGTGVTLSAPTTLAHAAGVALSANGITLGSPLALAHASGAAVSDPLATGVTVSTTSTTLAAAAAVGDKNVKITSTTGISAGQTISIDTGAATEYAMIYTVGTAGATGTGLTLINALTAAHASGAPVTAYPTIQTCNANFRTDAAAAWTADVGSAVIATYNNVFYVSAGEDESSTWQEFGQMMWEDKEDVPDSFGPTNPNRPNFAGTRYVEWTSFRAAATNWPNASGNTSVEGESAGMGTYGHEFSHNLSVPDDYLNGFADPPLRTPAGMWSPMVSGDRIGPGGIHTRWQIPSVMGGSMIGNHTLRDKIRYLGQPITDELQLNRNGLAASGLVVADITGRDVDPGTGLSGIDIKLDGTSPTDKTPPCTYTNILPSGENDWTCAGPSNYNDFTVEVVQKVGIESFQADQGVLITKTKTSASSCGMSGYSCYQWVIDAHPEDINIVDFYRPDGTPVMLTKGSNYQLWDALFHAGTNSGSQFEWTDPYNNLHFYVLDKYTDAQGVLHYHVGVQNPTGAGPQTRGVQVDNAPKVAVGSDNYAYCTFKVNNTGTAAYVTPSPHPQDASAWLNNDIYRLSATASGSGWHAQLPNALSTSAFGASADAQVYVTRDVSGADPGSVISLTATSVSDATKSSTATCFAADAVTTTTVKADFEPSQYGHPVVFSAAVSADPAAGIPGGAVQFSIDGATVGAPIALDASGLAALPPISSLAIGTHAVSAQYLGSGIFLPSSGSLNHVVKKRLATTTALTSAGPAVFSRDWTLNVLVSPENSGSGLNPGGSLQLKDNGLLLGPALPIGVGTLTTADFRFTIDCWWTYDPLTLHCTITIGFSASAARAAGNHNVRAIYSGDANYTGSTSPAAVQQVKKATPTGTVVADLQSPIHQTDRPTFTATFVNPVAPAGSLAGNVQFLIDGTNMGAPVALDPLTGQASFKPNWNLPTGTHTIKARYLGNANFLAVLSTGLSLKVTNP